MIKQQDTFEQLTRFRQSMYRVFAAAFLPPGPERFANLITDCMPLESAELGYLATYQKWHTWRKVLLHIDDAVESDVEYLRVFSAGMSGAVKPPLGHSYNIDPVRGDVGETLLDLARLYDEIRLEPTGAMSDALDHVSMELEIMSVLCAREAVVRTEGDDRRLGATLSSQVAFLDRHLSTWLPQFVNQITRMDSIPFYTALGPAVASFVHYDRGIAQFLVEEVARLEPSR